MCVCLRSLGICGNSLCLLLTDIAGIICFCIIVEYLRTYDFVFSSITLYLQNPFLRAAGAEKAGQKETVGRVFCCYCYTG